MLKRMFSVLMILALIASTTPALAYESDASRVMIVSAGIGSSVRFDVACLEMDGTDPGAGDPTADPPIPPNWEVTFGFTVAPEISAATRLMKIDYESNAGADAGVIIYTDNTNVNAVPQYTGPVTDSGGLVSWVDTTRQADLYVKEFDALQDPIVPIPDDSFAGWRRCFDISWEFLGAPDTWVASGPADVKYVYFAGDFRPFPLIQGLGTNQLVVELLHL